MRVQPQKHRRYAQTVLCFSVKRHETIKPLDAVAAGRTLSNIRKISNDRRKNQPVAFLALKRPFPHVSVKPYIPFVGIACHRKMENTTSTSTKLTCTLLGSGPHAAARWQCERPALNTHLSTTTFLWRRTEANWQSIVRRLKQRKTETP